jgi:hypothetical protein
VPNANCSFTTKPFSVPASIPMGDGVRVKIMQGATEIAAGTVALPNRAAIFPPLADGTYTCVAQRLNAAGDAVGPAAVSDEFTVVNMVDTEIPDVVTVVIG